MTNLDFMAAPYLEVPLSLSNPVRIADLAAQLNIPEATLVEKIKAVLEKYYRYFGIKPFIFEYISGQGYIARASSNVGVLRYDNLIFRIDSKIKGLSLAKIMAMAQLSSKNRFNISDSKISAQIKSDEDYSLIDLLGFSFLDAIEVVIRNGLHRVFYEHTEVSFGASSGINLEENISRGMVPPPVVDILESTVNTVPNQLLKYALEFLAANARNQILKDDTFNVLRSFIGVDTPKFLADVIESGDLFFTVPRSDYDRALSIGISLLNGANLNFDTGSSEFIPSCLLDLDSVFEDFCGMQLKRLFSSEIYEVLLQSSCSHNSMPLIQGSIIPDVVIRNKHTNKIIVVDLKNKYSQLQSGGLLSSANQDLFQIYYYGQVLNAAAVILLYPSTKPVWKYPLRGSEGEAKYKEKVSNSFAHENFPLIKLMVEAKSLDLYSLQVDLSKDMKNTSDSLASIASFIDYLCE
jgi:5-methylcytosine-specific restriction endonuclease McrBC regulatory subunit McrC